ncbi:MAG: Hsp70 family protein [Alphaproteobacteria bacterium]|nr:Hsp70 family protein [Alphaproteobacteria bacterium]
MSSGKIGIDFGTSNSAAAIAQGGEVTLIELEGNNVTIPTAVFFNVEENRTVFGRTAINEYLEGYSGRLMRSLKSILGTDLIKESTQVGYDRVNFSDVIGMFLRHIKSTCEDKVQEELNDVVLGRPVFFVDDNPEADKRAENELKKAAMKEGFRSVFFEYEPIAAARDYESTLTKEELVLVADIGGGTSDFSLIRLSPANRSKDDRKADILANSGVHIGGTDIDRKFSLKSIMPDMGYKSKLIGGLDMPVSPYHTLATWHLINTLYTPKNKAFLRGLYRQSASKSTVDRLIAVVGSHRGHELAGVVEAAKISLSESGTTSLDLDFVEKGWVLNLTSLDLKEAAKAEIDKIVDVAKKTVTHAGGIDTSDIHTVFMTGGSTGLPGFYEAMQRAFPEAVLVRGDKFSSVAKGLGISAMHRHGENSA